MTLETFFDKFDQFADAPDAVAKMRQIVLDLAVKGKLTARDTKKESVESEYSDEPSDDELPSNWRLLNFGKFCDIQGGNQPPKSEFIDSPKPGYVRLFQIRDLGTRPVPTYIPEDSTKRFCHPGEILIGRYGASVGKVFWAQEGAYNVALAKFLFPETALFPDFAFRVLKSDFFQAAVEGASRSAQAGFNKGDLAAINFPLPPLAEQKRIVAKVDELMALCDRLEAQQQERDTRHAALARASLARFAEAPTPANLEFLFHSSFHIQPSSLRKSILTLAVQGKLVPQDPNDEPASELFGRIVKKNANKKTLPEPTHPLAALPDTWKWTTSGYIGDIKLGRQRSPKDHNGPHMIPYLRVANVHDNRLKLSDVKEMNFTPDEQKTFRLKVGDILLNEGQSRELVGRPAIYRGEIPGCCFQNTLLRLRTHEGVDPDYSLLYFRHCLYSGRFQKAVKQTTNMAHLSAGRLSPIEFPLPPLAEQRRIVAKVDQLMALVDELERQLAASRATAKNLLQALVAELTIASSAGGSESTPRKN
ncbi:restriction endonuclease subunit S [Verrucomicrobiaceae bacterium 227]